MASDVRLENVSKNFGSFRALDDVSLHIRAGEFMSVLGASGAGKSTVLRLIGGFELPDTGKILIGGQDVTWLSAHKRNVNTVFQSYALFPHMNIAENVAYGLRQDGVPGKERMARVREALDMVQLTHLANRFPGQLSGGQQQRVALARALVKRPAVLLLDEPLGALDRSLRQQMQVELKMLQHRLKLTFVFVTHDQEEAMAMSDRITVMRDGRIEQVGTPAELYDEPNSAFVAGFVGAQNFITGVFEDPASGAVSTSEGIRLTAERQHGDLNRGEKVLVAVRPENVMLSKLKPEGDTNGLPGRVMAARMLGDTLEYVIATHAGECHARVHRFTKDLPAEGEDVWLHWPAARTTLYQFDPSALGEQGAPALQDAAQ